MIRFATRVVLILALLGVVGAFAHAQEAPRRRSSPANRRSMRVLAQDLTVRFCEPLPLGSS
jgi:hypothetical protein